MELGQVVELLVLEHVDVDSGHVVVVEVHVVVVDGHEDELGEWQSEVEDVHDEEELGG